MGTNISKGLKDRRSRSSTSLYKAKNLRPGKLFTPNRITRQERYKLSGSLPNFLDIKSPGAGGDFREREIYADNNNETKEKMLDIGRFEKYEEGLNNYSLVFAEKPRSTPPPPPPEDKENGPVAPKRRLSSKRASHNKSICIDDATFDVTLNKGHGGLGLSISGGKNSDDQSYGLISIKKLFPHQAAWQSGRLQVGDILLAVNGVPLTGLTNFEALEVLRKSTNPVNLTVRRPVGPQKSPEPLTKATEQRKSPEPHDQNNSTLNKSNTSSSSPPPSLPPSFLEDGPSEFEITLKKVNGSLGFTLRKEEGSLGHYVRALVKEPALSDGRIHPGDRIVSVNGVDLSALSHERAVAFLRQCGEEVRLRLHRDPTRSPDSTAPQLKQPKPILRKEAMEMLSEKKRNESSNSRQRSKSALANSREQIKKNDFHSSYEESDSMDTLDGPGSLPECSLPYNPFQHDSLVLHTGVFGPPGPGSLDLSQVPDAAASMPPILDLNPKRDLPDAADAPASMPPLQDPSESNFGHNSPVYQSTHFPAKGLESRKVSERSSEHDLSSTSFAEESKGGLLKWKGVMFTPEDQDDAFHTPSVSPPPSFDDKQLIKVELVRSWNSRLGFSLTSAKDGEGAIVSTIHPNSVAAKNGQLQNGDILVKVNEEEVTNLPTSEVIELLRRVRGAVVLYVLRQESNH